MTLPLSLGEGVSLRPLCEGDADALCRLTRLPQVGGHLRYGAHTCREQAAALLAEYLSPGCHAYGVLDAAGELSGAAVLKEDKERPGNSHVTLFLAPHLWNRGISTQLLARLCRLAATLGCSTVTAYVFEENIGSLRVCEKNGFVPIHRFTQEQGGVAVLQKQLEENR